MLYERCKYSFSILHSLRPIKRDLHKRPTDRHTELCISFVLVYSSFARRHTLYTLHVGEKNYIARFIFPVMNITRVILYIKARQLALFFLDFLHVQSNLKGPREIHFKLTQVFYLLPLNINKIIIFNKEQTAK